MKVDNQAASSSKKEKIRSEYRSKSLRVFCIMFAIMFVLKCSKLMRGVTERVSIVA